MRDGGSGIGVDELLGATSFEKIYAFAVGARYVFTCWRRHCRISEVWDAYCIRVVQRFDCLVSCGIVVENI